MCRIERALLASFSVQFKKKKVSRKKVRGDIYIPQIIKRPARQEVDFFLVEPCKLHLLKKRHPAILESITQKCGGLF